ncbi:MAG: NAD(P)H-dependent flavin oxidoreductase [Pseudomonadales bacterium]
MSPTPAVQPFLTRFELTAPLVQGPMGGISGPRLVAAVCNAGSLGILPIWALPPKHVAASIAAARALTQRRFAVNVRADLKQLEHIDIALDCGVTDFHLFWGDAEPSMAPLRRAGATVLATVSDGDSTRAALDTGASVLIAQGVEAGGHVRSETPLATLLPQTIELASSQEGVLVLAAGGCATAADVDQQLTAGAAGVLLGTRFAASSEADAHPEYQRALLRAGPNDTVRSLCFDDGWSNAPHRTLINDTWRRWQGAGAPGKGHRPGEADAIMHSKAGRAVYRYSMNPPMQGMTGTVTDAAMYAGTSAARLEHVLPAAQIIQSLYPQPD